MNRRVTSHCLTVCRCDGSREGKPPVKKSLYGERDYAFGQLVLTLRTTIGLTQAGLGERLGVSRRAVAEWEGGLSYPKAERLQQLIALGVRASAFAAVRDAPGCSELVADCITFFSDTPPASFPASLEQRINQLLSRLQARRCLLVLDNLETLLQSGDRAGNYLPGYEGYGRLIGRLTESAHQSCVLLTSREKPKEIEQIGRASCRERV